MPIESRLPLEIREGEIVVGYLGPEDQPWLRSLIEIFDAYTGKRVRQLRDRLTEPLSVAAPWPKRHAATTVLWRLFQGMTRAPVQPPRARAALFAEAAAAGAEEDREGRTSIPSVGAHHGCGGGPSDEPQPNRDARTRLLQIAAHRGRASSPSEEPHRDRAEILRRAAGKLGVTAEQLWRSLFADVPGEREVIPPAEIPSPSELALRTNLAIVQQLVRCSAQVRIRAEGNLRALVRLAKLRGLICTVAEARDPHGESHPHGRHLPGAAGTSLDLSGPLSLFRRTLLYGRALADLVPLLAWCPRFHLAATCLVRGETARLVLANGAPIFPGREPRRFDSLVEERFARAFARAAPDWELVREPDAFRAGGMLIFPDFLIRHRKDPARRWLLEIVGFWTRDYLEKKLAALRAASMPNLILCIDEDRNCATSELPLTANVIRYRRKLTAAAVLEVIEERDRPPPKVETGMTEG